MNEFNKLDIKEDGSLNLLIYEPCPYQELVFTKEEVIRLIKRLIEAVPDWNDYEEIEDLKEKEFMEKLFSSGACVGHVPKKTRFVKK